MKNFLLVLLLLCTGLTGAFAISSNITGGPSSALCPGSTTTFTASVNSQETTFFPVVGMRIIISGGASNSINFVIPNNAGITCAPLAGDPNTVICLDGTGGGGGFSVSVNTTWTTSGTLTVQALRPNLNVASTSTASVSVLPTNIGGVSIEGPTNVGTNSFVDYLAVTTVSGNSLSNINWIVPPGAQVFGGTNGQGVLMVFSSPGTYELAVTATVTASCGGGSAQRGTGITINVTNGGGGIFLKAPDDPNLTLEMAQPDIDESNLINKRNLDDENKAGLLFPNPISSGQILQYQLPESIDLTENLSARILDNQGRLVQNIQLQDQVTTIATDRLATGIYYIQIISKEYTDTQTFIVE